MGCGSDCEKPFFLLLVVLCDGVVGMRGGMRMLCVWQSTGRPRRQAAQEGEVRRRRDIRSDLLNSQESDELHNTTSRSACHSTDCPSFDEYDRSEDSDDGDDGTNSEDWDDDQEEEEDVTNSEDSDDEEQGEADVSDSSSDQESDPHYMTGDGDDEVQGHVFPTLYLATDERGC